MTSQYRIIYYISTIFYIRSIKFYCLRLLL
nr:MAG TPA: hypothetical protein [Caudoviricetes sp.]